MKKEVTKDNCLLTVNPKLALEWDYEKNRPLTPEMITSVSGKKVWWRCDAGHSWQAKISNRKNGRCCPYCSNKKVCPDNCLATKFPKLLKEWDFQKNKELTPYNVVYGSDKRAFWICSLGHSWDCQISSRTIQSTNCPYCDGKRVSKENCLATINPELTKEWHPTKNGKLTPWDVTCNSSKFVWWMCDQGHEWLAVLSSRNVGNGCPYCSNRSVNLDNCLATRFPELAKEWHPTKNGKLTPWDVNIGSSKSVYWICDKGHEWIGKICHRINKNLSKKTLCPYCSNLKICNDNCLATLNPTLTKQWDYERNKGLSPYKIGANANKKVWWICDKNHSWEANICLRHHGSGCPFCDGYSLKSGEYCDSLNEAYFLLEFKRNEIKFEYNKKYGGELGGMRYDFYLVDENKYIEVTSYNSHCEFWNQYYERICKKKKYVEQKLKAKFEFIQIRLTKKQREYVKSNLKI